MVEIDIIIRATTCGLPDPDVEPGPRWVSGVLLFQDTPLTGDEVASRPGGPRTILASGPRIPYTYPGSGMDYFNRTLGIIP